MEVLEMRHWQPATVLDFKGNEPLQLICGN